MSDVKFKRLPSILLLAGLAFAQSDPWPPSAILAPATLASQLKSNNSPPPVIYVGFPVLYKGAHIVRALLAGPASRPEGLALLTKAVQGLPHDAEIILYCGCCPFIKCPNIRPAFHALKDAGYTHIKVLQLDTNLHSDWVEKGYPIAAK